MYIIASLLLLFIGIFVFLYKFVKTIPTIYDKLNCIHEFEEQLSCKVIYLIDKNPDIKCINMEKNILGEIIGYDIDNSYNIMDALADAHIHHKDIYLIIHSSGGLAESCDEIVKFIEIIRQNGCHITAIIPEHAYSSACAIAFACNKIQMANLAVVFPTDPIIDSDDVSYSIASAIKAYKNITNIDTSHAIDLAKHYEDINLFNWNKKIMRKNLKNFFNWKQKNSTAKFNNVVNLLCDGDIPHHVIFGRHDLSNFGLKIDRIDKSISYDIISFCKYRFFLKNIYVYFKYFAPYTVILLYLLCAITYLVRIRAIC
jgi:hypothetical protein